MNRRGSGSRKWLILLIIIILIFYGRPKEIKLTGEPPFIEVTWKKEEPQLSQPQFQPAPTQTIPPPSIPEIRIESIKTRQEVYQPGDKAYLDIIIINELNIPYNLTVDWIYNNTRKHGWFNVSTDYYDTKIVKNEWESWWEPVNEIGVWEVHVVVKYSLQNRTFSTDKIARF